MSFTRDQEALRLAARGRSDVVYYMPVNATVRQRVVKATPRTTEVAANATKLGKVKEVARARKLRTKRGYLLLMRED